MELCTPSAVLRTGAADPKRSRAAYPPPRLVVSYIDTEIDHKLKKNSREQVIKAYSKMMPKSIQNEGSGASFLGGRAVMLELFWGSNASWEAFWAALG